MARKSRKDNSKLREMMDEYGVKTMEDVQNFVKMLKMSISLDRNTTSVAVVFL